MNYLLKVSAAWLLVNFILLFPSCYLLGELPPQRTWILVTFLHCAAIATAGIVAGTYLRGSGMLRIIASAGILMLMVFIVRSIVVQKEITGTYAAAVDSRMQFLTTLVNPEDSTTIILERLPSSGMLTSAEIFIDTSDFRNRHLKKFLGMKGGLRIK